MVKKTQKTPQEIARENVAAKKRTGIGVTQHTSGRPIKGLAAEPVLAKPQRRMLRTIAKMGKHPGTGNCVKRWHLYREGMTLLDAKTTDGLTPNDVTFWADCGYLTLREPTDDEYAAAVAKWEKARAAAERAEKAAEKAKARKGKGEKPQKQTADQPAAEAPAPEAAAS